MPRFALVAFALVVLGWSGATGDAQSTPDFSGQWKLEPPSSAQPAQPPAAGGAPAPRSDMGSGWGSTITIAQDAKQLAIEYVQFSRYDLQPPVKLVYALDGSESRNSVMISHASQVQRSRAAWDGPSLVITTLHSFTDPASGKAMTAEVKQRLSLSSPTTLVVEVIRGGVLGGQPATTTTIYRKG